MSDLRTTPLDGFHREHGAKMAGFAGYDMPIQYPLGVMGEHGWCRENAALFDVSHMGQAMLRGPDFAAVADALEALTPGAIATLAPGEMRYTLLLNDDGGILDDLIATRPAEEPDALFLVVNAACKEADYAHMEPRLPAGVTLEPLEDQALIALQGPKADAVLAAHAPDAADALTFMTAGAGTIAGAPARITRSGYTGEDGFELSVPASAAVDVAAALMEDDRVALAGLGARDSLRLEAGLCLYGHDMDAETTPIEASLTWAVAKARREAGGFPGHAAIARHLTDGAPRKRVGFVMDARVPAREGASVMDGDAAVGIVTSGGFGPTVQKAIGMAYVPPHLAKAGTALEIDVRGKRRGATVTAMPFAPQRYKR